jgi:hypothetical protein
MTLFNLNTKSKKSSIHMGDALAEAHINLNGKKPDFTGYKQTPLCA